MAKIKLNRLELDLLKKAVGWYYKEFKDKELRESIAKENPTKADLEKMKDAVELYHRKGYVSKEQHIAMNSLFEKFGKNVKSVMEKEKEAAEKAKAKRLKEQAENERKEKAKLEKAKLKEAEEAEKRAKELEAAQAELKEEKHLISDVFIDLSED